MKHRDGNSIKNSKEFADFIVSQVIEEDEIVVSFDVVALFTSIPIPLAIQVVDDKLKEDESWMQFTSFNRNHIIELLKLVRYGLAAVSAVIAELVMDYIGTKSLATFPTKPRR